MAQRLPTVGGDGATWGTILDGYLSVGHNADGTHHVYDAKEYGAKGDGTTDDTTAIQSAITAAQTAGGGVVFFPTGTYIVSNTLNVTTDNVQLVGAGWGSIIEPAAAWPAGNYIVFVQQPVAGERLGFACKSLFFNCNSVAGVNAIRLQSTYFALLDNVRIRFCAGNAVFFDGTSGQFGAYTTLRHCVITDGVGATANGLYVNNFHEWGLIADCAVQWYSTSGSVGINFSSTDNWRIEDCTFDHNDTAVWLSFFTNTRITGCNFDRALTTFIRLTGTRGCAIEGNMFNDYAGVGASPFMITIDGNSSNYRNLIRRNRVDRLNVVNWGTGDFAHEGTAGGSTGANIYEGNETEGLPIVGNPSTLPTIRNNPGVNPVTQLPIPAAPVPTTLTTGGTILAGVYGVEITYVNAYGETTPSPNGPITTTGSTSTITIPSPPWIGSAKGWYAYVTQVNGATFTRQQTAGAPTAIGTSLVLTAPPTNTGATPPGGNTTAAFSQPAVPASGVVFPNPTPYDCTVYVTGGTVTAIAVGGLTTGAVSGPIHVPARATITLTYSVAPTWVWIGE